MFLEVFFPVLHLELYLKIFNYSDDVTSKDTRVWKEGLYRMSKMSNRRYSCSFRWRDNSSLHLLMYRLLVN